jgi:hypothetical protein
MKLKVLLVAALVLVVVGFVCFGQAVNGNINASAGWPVASGTSLHVCVTVTGWWAVAGGCCTMLGSVLLIAGIVKFAFFKAPVTRDAI